MIAISYEFRVLEKDVSNLTFCPFPRKLFSLRPKFIDAADAIGIMSLAIVPEAIIMLLMSKILGYEKSKFVLIAKMVSLVTLILGFIILGPLYGIIGLAFTLVIATVLQCGILGFSYLLIRKEKNVREK